MNNNDHKSYKIFGYTEEDLKDLELKKVSKGKIINETYNKNNLKSEAIDINEILNRGSYEQQ